MTGATGGAGTAAEAVSGGGVDHTYDGWGSVPV